jgi:hypothetical protein
LTEVEIEFDDVFMLGETVQLTVSARGARPAAAWQDNDVLPVLPALRDLLPAGGLRRGTVLAAGRWGLLCAALIAAASAAGGWCAIVGLPTAGILAAAEAGADPCRMLLVPDPGRRWPQVVTTLLEACEIVLAGPPARPPVPVRRKIEATARRSGAVLLIAGDWQGAPVRLTVVRQQWIGAGIGHGRLRCRRALVEASGRGAAGRPRASWLWLPGPDGKITAAGEAAQPATPGMPWQQAGTG